MRTRDIQAIEQLFEGFAKAFTDGDVETLRSFYTDDVLVIPPGQKSVSGRDAVVDQLWSPVFDAFDVDAELPIDEIQAEHEWRFVRGTYRLRLVPAGGGEPLVEEGRYIDMVRKDADGVWKIARAIWNVAESRDPGDVADDG